MIQVSYAVEGWADEPVAERLIAHAGQRPKRILTAQGKSRMDAKLPGVNRSGQHRLWLVVRDLDHDDRGTCIAEVRRRLIGGEASIGMALRFAVRAMESWLLADLDGFSQFFRVDRSGVPRDPDALDQPKEALVNICRRSRSGAIRSAVVPRDGSGRAGGPEYAATMREFVVSSWDVARAAQASPSLARAVAGVRRMVGQFT